MKASGTPHLAGSASRGCTRNTGASLEEGLCLRDTSHAGTLTNALQCLSPVLIHGVSPRRTPEAFVIKAMSHFDFCKVCSRFKRQTEAWPTEDDEAH